MSSVVSLAIVLQQRNRHAGNRGRFHVRKRLFQHRQTTDAHDRVDLAGLNQCHDQRRAFGHQHGITQPLGFVLQILNRALAALLAEQAEVVERRRAVVFQPQALGQQQQPAFVRHRRQRIAPHAAIQHHADIVMILGRQARQARPRHRNAAATLPSTTAAPAALDRHSDRSLRRNPLPLVALSAGYSLAAAARAAAARAAELDDRKVHRLAPGKRIVRGGTGWGGKAGWLNA